VHDQAATSPDARVARILAAADLCVKCGLCLPHCPTYGLARDEGESPRGRIALIQGLAAGQLGPSARLAGHLDRCLGCRACEAACPAGVPYGHLFDEGRALLREARPAGPLRRALQWLASEGTVRPPAGLRAALALARRYGTSRHRPGIERLLGRVWPAAGRLARYLPPLSPAGAWRGVYPAVGEPRGEVALFLGCVAREVDRAALEASIRVLNRLGYAVRVPESQGCCGAIHLHDGAQAQARRLALRNLEAFGPLGDLPVVVAASGCAATLLEYGELAGLSAEQASAAAALGRRVTDVSDLIAGLSWPAVLPVAPLHARVAVHEPCSLRNVLRRRSAPYALLARIPGLETVPLPGNERCCGAAGSYMLTQARLADRLRDLKLDGLAATGARIIASANVGCVLHLAAGVAARGEPVEVLHPVVLLDRQMAGEASRRACL
jgi:glycolate oxidase iron-sulfur subunit